MQPGEIEGRSVSDGVEANQAANEAIEETERIDLAGEERDRFVKLLLEPAIPNVAMERAKLAHTALIRQTD